MMNNSERTIKCPNCEEMINVDDILYHQLEEDIRKKYEEKARESATELARIEEDLKSRKIDLDQKEKEIKDQIEKEVEEKVIAGRGRLMEEIKTKIELENAGKFKALQSELFEKTEKVKQLNLAQTEIEKLKREKSELREEIELENQKKISELMREERMKIAKQEAERAEFKLSEKENVINQLREQLSVAQRKAEQGSMQLQGEVQELGIEQWLKESFPLDEIEEIKKGQRGADVIQVVRTRSNPDCGRIYYESKRTKDFQPSWIEKFKSDLRDRNANLGVIVTEAMPKGMERMGQVDGVWICNYQEFKGLCTVLRENVIAISNAVASQENKGDKMVMLYDFLTSNEFRMQIEAIVEGFTQMQEDLTKEKRSMQGHWKKREKQIEKVLLNTNFMYSSIKGIAGSAIQSVKQLELPDSEDIQEDE